MQRIMIRSFKPYLIITTLIRAVLQIGRSLVLFQMVSLEFFIDIKLPIALWSVSNRNEYQENFLGVNAAGV